MLSKSSTPSLPSLEALEAARARIKAEADRRRRQRLFYRLFPDEDTVQPDGSIIHARHKYQKHLEFFEAGAEYPERCAMAANRVGKTLGIGGYVTAAHLTALPPPFG